VIVIIVACIATNSIDLSKIIPGFGHYEKPQLKKDDLLIGYKDKYFFASNTNEKLIRNASKSFDIYEESKKSTELWAKISDVDTFVNSKTAKDAYILDTVKNEQSETTFAVITMGTRKKVSDDEDKKTDEYESRILLSCQEKSSVFEVDDMQINCGKTTQSDIKEIIEKQQAGTNSENVENIYMYKNYELNFSYRTSGLVSNVVIVLPNNI
jgi:hypothetical protein